MAITKEVLAQAYAEGYALEEKIENGERFVLPNNPFKAGSKNCKIWGDEYSKGVQQASKDSWEKQSKELKEQSEAFYADFTFKAKPFNMASQSSM